MMQVIDFFFFFFAFCLLRACYCIFSQRVSAQRLSIVSWCDQNMEVDRQVNKQVFVAYLPPGRSAGKPPRWSHKEETASSSQGFPLSTSRPALQSSILFSLAQSCSVVHECQLSAASTLYLSLPLPLPLALPQVSQPLFFLPHSLSPSLSSLSVQRKNDCK